MKIMGNTYYLLYVALEKNQEIFLRQIWIMPNPVFLTWVVFLWKSAHCSVMIPATVSLHNETNMIDWMVRGIFLVQEPTLDFLSPYKDIRENLPACLNQTNRINFHESFFLNGVVRRTMAVKSKAFHSVSCNRVLDESVNILQHNLDIVEQNILRALFPPNTVNYVSEESLDHFHYYEKSVGEAINENSESLTLDLHIDKGLFLLLSPEKGLIVRNPVDGLLYDIEAPENSLVVLAGKGLSQFLNHSDYIRPLEHGVKKTQKSRVTVARMILPSKEAVSFWQEFHRLPESSLASPHAQRNLKECAAGEVYCWMQCMTSDCGDRAICQDKDTHDVCPSSGMHPECGLVCPQVPAPLANVSTDSKQFCFSKSSMLMQGFEFSSLRGSTCIILLFKSWVLDTRPKLLLGCIFVFSLGFALEYVTAYRRRQSNAFLKWKYGRHYSVFLFASSLVLAYLCMLVAMTYSVELFFSVICGFTVGHYLNRSYLAPVSQFVEPCCSALDVQESGMLVVSAGDASDASDEGGPGGCCADGSSNRTEHYTALTFGLTSPLTSNVRNVPVYDSDSRARRAD